MNTAKCLAVAAVCLAAACAAGGVDSVLWIGGGAGDVFEGPIGGSSFEKRFTMSVRVTSMASKGAVLYAGNVHGRLVSFDPASGELTEIGVIAGDNRSMVVAGEHLLVGASDGIIRRVEIATGAVVETYPIVEGLGLGLPAMAIEGTTVWAADGKNGIYKGTVTGSFEKIGSYSGFSPTGMAVSGDALFISTVDGLHKLDKVDASFIAKFDVEVNGEDVEAHGGEVLLGTFHAGVFRVDPATGAVLGVFAEAQPIESLAVAEGTCIADFDGDGDLDINDFIALRSAFVAGDLRADINGDGKLDINDFIVFQAAFRRGC